MRMATSTCQGFLVEIVEGKQVVKEVLPKLN